MVSTYATPESLRGEFIVNCYTVVLFTRLLMSPKIAFIPCSGDPLTTGQPAATELSTCQTSIQQAAPPAESEPQPEVIFPASTVVSFSLDECPPSVEQSVRVEPSPERIYMLPSCAEEDETMSPLSASSGQWSLHKSQQAYAGLPL